ncbi:MAG: acyl-CoA dehydrogenase family protein, partial [Burkholderiales bacterium]|nr:acyl-CoA dehydrogenase family protein [Burkholderiales bacterium]
MIDFQLTGEQVMLREVAARFVREHLGMAAYRRSAASPLGFDAATWQSFADLGWLALPDER